MPESWSKYVPPQLQNSKSFYVIITDIEGGYVYANELFLERFSFISKNFKGLPFETTVHQGDVERCNAAAWTCMQDLSARVPIVVRKPIDNYSEYYLTQWEFSAIAEDGAPIGLLCIGYDITESRQNSMAVQRYAKKLSSIINNISDGLFIVDENWCFLTINNAAEKILRREGEKIMGKSIWEVFPRFSEYQYVDHYIRAMREQKRQSFEDYNEATETYLQITIYPSSEGLTVLLRDVSEAQRLQNYLWESRTKLRAILDSTKEVHVLVGLDYCLRSFNKTAEAYLEKYLNRLPKVGEDIRDYINKEQRVLFVRDFKKAVEGETLVHEELFTMEDSGEERWFRLRYNPAYDDKGSLLGVSITGLDIDKEKRAQQHILRQNEHLRSIAHIQSHEVRRPLANLIGLLQIFETDSLDEQQRELLLLLDQSVQELDKIVSDIVGMAEQMDS